MPAIRWIVKDGLAHFAKLAFTKKYAYAFDYRPKTWGVLGEAMLIAGSTFELSTALAATYGYAYLFIPLAAVGASLQSVAHLAWEATHANFVRWLSLRNNIADITAKADSQMVVSELLGLGVGVAFITHWHQPWHLFACFAICAPIHLVCTLGRLRSVRFGMLSESRALQLFNAYVRHHAGFLPLPAAVQTEDVLAATGAALPAGVLELVDLDTLQPHHAVYDVLVSLAFADTWAHTLAWADPAPVNYSRGPALAFASAAPPATSQPVEALRIVELTRAGLVFAVRKDPHGLPQLYCQDHPHLYLSPLHRRVQQRIHAVPGADDWHATDAALPLLTALMAPLPRALLLQSAQAEFAIATAIFKPYRPRIKGRPLSSELVYALPPLDDGWLASFASPYLVYPVHSSLEFPLCPTVPSALYLLLHRVLARDYAGARALVDAVATDTHYTAPEALLLSHLEIANADEKADMQAVRIHLSHALRHAQVQLPWNVAQALAAYSGMSGFARVSAACRVGAGEELDMLEANLPGDVRALAIPHVDRAHWGPAPALYMLHNRRAFLRALAAARHADPAATRAEDLPADPFTDGAAFAMADEDALDAAGPLRATQYAPLCPPPSVAPALADSLFDVSPRAHASLERWLQWSWARPADPSP